MDLEGLTMLERGMPASGPESVLSNGRSGCALQASLTGPRGLCGWWDLETWRNFNDDTNGDQSGSISSIDCFCPNSLLLLTTSIFSIDRTLSQLTRTPSELRLLQ
jgi:hypothetical protein